LWFEITELQILVVCKIIASDKKPCVMVFGGSDGVTVSGIGGELCCARITTLAQQKTIERRTKRVAKS
jgi:hypothetical protein